MSDDKLNHFWIFVRISEKKIFLKNGLIAKLIQAVMNRKWKSSVAWWKDDDDGKATESLVPEFKAANY